MILVPIFNAVENIFVVKSHHHLLVAIESGLIVVTIEVVQIVYSPIVIVLSISLHVSRTSWYLSYASLGAR